MNRIAPTATLLASLLLAGCKPDPAVKKAEVIGRGSLAVNAYNVSADGGLVEGVVHFAGTAPARAKIDMSSDPACSGGNTTEQVVSSDGALANVYLYIKSGISQSNALPESKPVVLDERGCRFDPHVVAVQQGGAVEFRNSDPMLHTIHSQPQADGNPGVELSEAPGSATQVRQFSQPEVMLPVRSPSHAWMTAYINVAPTPFFAVTGSNGAYKIGGLPPGQYVLAAVHERLGEQDLALTVPPKGKVKQDFTFPGK